MTKTATHIYIRAMIALIDKAMAAPAFPAVRAAELVEDLVFSGLASTDYRESDGRAAITMFGVEATNRGLSARDLLTAWRDEARAHIDIGEVA